MTTLLDLAAVAGSLVIAFAIAGLVGAFIVHAYEAVCGE